jgi:hypothetical protein
MPKTRTKIELDVRLDDFARIKRHAAASRCSPEDYILRCADYLMDAIENGSLEEGRFGFPRKAAPMPVRTVPVHTTAPPPKRHRLSPTLWTAEKDAEFTRLYNDGKTYAEISKALCGDGKRVDRAGRRAFSEPALAKRRGILKLPPRGRGRNPAPKVTISFEEQIASMQASGLKLDDFQAAAKDVAPSLKGRFG